MIVKGITFFERMGQDLTTLNGILSLLILGLLIWIASWNHGFAPSDAYRRTNRRCENKGYGKI